MKSRWQSRYGLTGGRATNVCSERRVERPCPERCSEISALDDSSKVWRSLTRHKFRHWYDGKRSPYKLCLKHCNDGVLHDIALGYRPVTSKPFKVWSTAVNRPTNPFLQSPDFNFSCLFVFCTKKHEARYQPWKWRLCSYKNLQSGTKKKLLGT